ncbi:hypothetical protein AB0G35_12960 [Streptomyces sp. NPDC021749]|uniref:hypothetical protein n=1 Tax=Streptomyces sp. NPDC021749 TaxID=3154905 RepID=UPI0033F5CED8
MDASRPGYTAELLRHFADLRDGTHQRAVSREDKERLFARTVELLDPYARQALGEINEDLLLGTGEILATGMRSSDEGADAVWSLTWPEQRDAGVSPVVLHAFFGAGFHHPHLRGGALRDWPLNIFTEEQAAAKLSCLREIAAAQVHNLVFERDYRIIPATVKEHAY